MHGNGEGVLAINIPTFNREIILIKRIFDRRRPTIPIIHTAHQKPKCTVKSILQPFSRCTPEARGISSDHIAVFLDELCRDKTLDPHSIMILKNGSVISEGNFGAYDRNIWHATFSACKSITALAVGMLIDEGRLSIDEKIVNLFSKQVQPLSRVTLKNLTVRHLLTMTSGILFDEGGSVTETDWVKCYLNSMMRGDPGRQFHYNSMNTYMLSVIIRQVSGQGMMEYLEERLWKPLGIEEIFWETCPMGIEKGGWGLYIREEDMAKIGQLVLQKGRWGERQLVSEAWIREATTAQVTTPLSYGDYNYGYQIWVGRNQNTFLFNGMFGQNVLGYHDTGVLVISNSGNIECFQQGNFFKLAHEYFGCSFADGLPENAAAHSRLAVLQNNLRKPAPVMRAGWPKSLFHKRSEELPPECSEVDGKAFKPETAVHSVGLMPILLQMFQNNYTKGLKAIRFDIRNKDFFITFVEADESHTVPVGFGEAKYTDLTFHGEPYRIGTIGQFATDEDDNPVLKVRISFMEAASARLVKFFFEDGMLRMEWMESPGKKYLSESLASIKLDSISHPMIDTVLSKLDSDFIYYKIDAIFEPRLTAIPEEQR